MENQQIAQTPLMVLMFIQMLKNVNVDVDCDVVVDVDVDDDVDVGVMKILMLMLMEDNGHHGSCPLYGEFSKRQTTALPVRRTNHLLFVLFKMISCLESESPIFS